MTDLRARTNTQIRVPEVRLVGPDGTQLGVVPIAQALEAAADAGLDLVEVAPTAKPPVCKVLDYSKYRYDLEQKAKEARRHQTVTTIKEIKLRLKIDEHDYATKRGHVERFIGHGDKAKVSIMFRGREQQRPEMGTRLLERLVADLGDSVVVESSPRVDGRNMVMVLAPRKIRP